MIAVLLLRGRLSADREIMELFTGTPWNALNKKHKRNYAGAVQEAFERSDFSEEQIREAERSARTVYEELGKLPIRIVRKVRRTEREGK